MSYLDDMLLGNVTCEENVTCEVFQVYGIDPDMWPWVTALDVLALLITYGAMFCMGSEVTFQQFKQALLCPKYLSLGIMGQYLLMPFLGFVAVHSFTIEGVYAAGVMILSCSPGGGYSNLITYLFDGEVWLSVVLTTVSSVLAFGAMPLNFWVYSQAGVVGSVAIPYVKMVISLVLLNLALGLGMIAKWRLPKAAPVITKTGATVVSISNFIWLFLFLYINPLFFWNTSWRLYGAALLVAALGSTISVVSFYVCGFPWGVVKTLAIEITYQSVGSALTVALISFDRRVAMDVQAYIFLYALLTTSLGTLSGGLHQAVKKICYHRDSSAKSIHYSSVSHI